MKTWDEMTPLDVYEATQKYCVWACRPQLVKHELPWWEPEQPGNPHPGAWATPHPPLNWLAESGAKKCCFALPTRNVRPLMPRTTHDEVNPSPTLARIQAEHPKWADDGIYTHTMRYINALESAITDQNRQLAERDAEIARLREQLAEADAAVCELWEVLRECSDADSDEDGVDHLHCGSDHCSNFLALNGHLATYDAALARQEQRRKERE